ncbi:LppU/SCO3897 family protein [Mycobacteroides abscessus]|uniref:LppU/SCO3897 family protein n=1 Tax=Mycobacteroides abscessus TaxID=36809 RepID=UPI003AF860D2
MKIRILVIAACAVALTACEQLEKPTPADPASPSTRESMDFNNIPGQFPSPATLTTNGQAEAPVGGCVNLSGPAVNAVLTLVDCGSPQHTYRIVQRVNVPQECGDIDRSYYHNSQATGQYTACLDLAWDASACISLAQPVAKVSCTDPNAPRKIKPTKIVLDSTTLDSCPDGGYPHPVRKFTVCTETQD